MGRRVYSESFCPGKTALPKISVAASFTMKMPPSSEPTSRIPSGTAFTAARISIRQTSSSSENFLCS
jgi:hypothetical protein